VRVEFWGDEVSEMRMFSVADQRSIAEIDVDTLIAVPCREVLLTDDVRIRAFELAAEHPVLDNSVSGGVPDNRGIVRASVQIDPAAPATRDTMLPIDRINDALVALGEQPQHSRDPGRYICNNVMFDDIGAMQSRGIGGFIHLPYTVTFDQATKDRYAHVVQAAIQATVDSL